MADTATDAEVIRHGGLCRDLVMHTALTVHCIDYLASARRETEDIESHNALVIAVEAMMKGTAKRIESFEHSDKAIDRLRGSTDHPVDIGGMVSLSYAESAFFWTRSKYRKAGLLPDSGEATQAPIAKDAESKVTFDFKLVFGVNDVKEIRLGLRRLQGLIAEFAREGEFKDDKDLPHWTVMRANIDKEVQRAIGRPPQYGSLNAKTLDSELHKHFRNGNERVVELFRKGLSNSAVAARVGKSVAAVKQTKSRAKKNGLLDS